MIAVRPTHPHSVPITMAHTSPTE
uniref:Uncharacterized protein n=1 Tax=Anguilla anguilla TaxID=7936 RepID=A0A0E9T4P1_ANGAN